MDIWIELARARTIAGDEISLRQRSDLYEIRYNGMELMSSSTHHSEDLLAEKALRLLARPARRVLIGGLGLGFTLRTALRFLDHRAEVVVCEIIPEVVDWNRRYLGGLAGHPLDDPRVEVRIEDVMETLGSEQGTYDVILMDTDNGPDNTVRAPNGLIYETRGISAVKNSLRPDGLAAFWSATRSPGFEERLSALRWSGLCDCVSLPGASADAFHYIYLARRDAASLDQPPARGEPEKTVDPSPRAG